MSYFLVSSVVVLRVLIVYKITTYLVVKFSPLTFLSIDIKAFVTIKKVSKYVYIIDSFNFSVCLSVTTAKTRV